MAEKERLLREDGGPVQQEGGHAEVLISERASATPVRPGLQTERDSVGKSGASIEGGVEGPLNLLQDWFSQVLMHPRSAADGVQAAAPLQEKLGAANVEELVTPSSTLSAVERLDLYQYAYHARLVECLADDYPSVKFAVGEKTFDTIARKYVEVHPSQNPNLNYFGRSFAGFCREQTWLDNYNFLADLSALEWAMVEVLHAAQSETLSLDALQSATPEQTEGLTLKAAPTLRFLRHDYPVNAFLQAYRNEEKPPIPARAPSATAVYRTGFTIWRMSFTQDMADVLERLLAGAPLGEALAGIPAAAEGDVTVWFKEWVAGGFFSELALG